MYEYNYPLQPNFTCQKKRKNVDRCINTSSLLAKVTHKNPAAALYLCAISDSQNQHTQVHTFVRFEGNFFDFMNIETYIGKKFFFHTLIFFFLIPRILVKNFLKIFIEHLGKFSTTVGKLARLCACKLLRKKKGKTFSTKNHKTFALFFKSSRLA